MRQATLSGDNLQDIVESPDEEGLDQESGISHNGTPLNREVVKSNANCYPDTVKASEPSVDENNNDICNEEQNKEEMNVLSSSNGLIEDVGTTSLRKEERSHDVSS